MIVAGEEVVAWVALGIGHHTVSQHATGVGWEVDGKLVAGLIYEGFTGPSIMTHSLCVDRKRVSRAFFFAIFDYPFNQLGVKCVRGIVSSANLAAQRVNEKLGFRREVLLKDYFPDGDGIVYCMRREECRWLKLGEYYGQKRAGGA